MYVLQHYCSLLADTMKKHIEVFIIGAGTTGMMTASQLLGQKPFLNVGILHAAEVHCCQSVWPFVGVEKYNYVKSAQSKII